VAPDLLIFGPHDYTSRHLEDLSALAAKVGLA
jgi:hypothetical protein